MKSYFFTCFVFIIKTLFKNVIKICTEKFTLSRSCFYTVTDLPKYHEVTWFLIVKFVLILLIKTQLNSVFEVNKLR
jgi:hypothetical protein